MTESHRYAASQTHYDAWGVKTSTSVEVVAVAVARALADTSGYVAGKPPGAGDVGVGVGIGVDGGASGLGRGGGGGGGVVAAAMAAANEQRECSSLSLGGESADGRANGSHDNDRNGTTSGNDGHDSSDVGNEELWTVALKAGGR